MSKLPSIYLLIVLWVFWCSLHSLLISGFIVTGMKKALGERFAYYRVIFNVFSLVALIPILIYEFSIPEEVIFAWPGPWEILRLGMVGASFLLFYGGAKVYDLKYVLGIKQVDELRQGIRPEPMIFNTSGILHFVRHPWYSGAILFIWAFGRISDVSLVTKIILTAYVIIGTFLEEIKLVRDIGAPYAEYRQKVPMLIPWKLINVLQWKNSSR